MHLLPLLSRHMKDSFHISKVGKIGFNDRIYMISGTKFRVEQYTQISNSIHLGETVSKNVHKEGIFEPFIYIHRTKGYKLCFIGIQVKLIFKPPKQNVTQTGLELMK